MEYRLIGDGDGPLRSSLERRVIGLLSSRKMTSREVAEGIGASIGSVRNLLTRLVGRGDVYVVWIDGRERVYRAT